MKIRKTSDMWKVTGRRYGGRPDLHTEAGSKKEARRHAAAMKALGFKYIYIERQQMYSPERPEAEGR